MASRKNMIEDILNKLNTSNITTILINIDELDTLKDSICLVETEVSAETPVDVTVKDWVEGTLNLGVMYRGITVDDGVDDLVYNKVVDDLISYLRLNYKTIVTNGYTLDLIKDSQGSKLETVYSDGTKDFKGVVKIVYTRQL